MNTNTSKSNKQEIQNKLVNLQLGDIIKITSPNNDALDNKIYYINFINKEKIHLLSSDDNITLDIKNNIILEESITKISLLFRNEYPGYVKQNNINIGNILSLYFGGDLPKVLNTKVTNIEEDMVELLDLENNNVYYIDFEYSGIPENLNIEKIIIKQNNIQSEKLEKINQQEGEYEGEYEGEQFI